MYVCVCMFIEIVLCAWVCKYYPVGLFGYCLQPHAVGYVLLLLTRAFEYINRIFLELFKSL